MLGSGQALQQVGRSQPGAEKADARGSKYGCTSHGLLRCWAEEQKLGACKAENNQTALSLGKTENQARTWAHCNKADRH